MCVRARKNDKIYESGRTMCILSLVPLVGVPSPLGRGLLLCSMLDVQLWDLLQLGRWEIVGVKRGLSPPLQPD